MIHPPSPILPVGLPKFIVSNQKEESISAYGVKASQSFYGSSRIWGYFQQNIGKNFQN